MKKIKYKGRGVIANGDCLEVMKTIPDNYVDLFLTDIPYDGINRKSNGLRNLDKGKADVITFDLMKFLQEANRITKGTIIIFCGINQLSGIFNYFNKQKGSVRQLVWNKTNPTPLNCDKLYLSAIENAIYFKKPKAIFNPKYKSCVFTFSCGKSKIHPTQKKL